MTVWSGFKRTVLFAGVPFHWPAWRIEYGQQLKLIGNVLGRVYARLGLLSAEDEAEGILGVLSAAAGNWTRQWLPVLLAGWRQGHGEGLVGRIGGAAGAVWDGRREVVAQLAAVIIGWASLAAIAVGAMSLLLHLGISTAHAAASTVTSDTARSILADLFPFFGAGTALAHGLGQMAAVLSSLALWCAGIAAIWSSGVMVVDYSLQPELARQQYQPWMFILRLVLAFGCLVPVNSGWNLGQILAGNLGRYGSDQASAAWSNAVSYLTSDNITIAPPISQPDVLSVIVQTAAAEACAAAINLDPARNKNEHVAPNASGTGETISYDYQIKGTLWGWNTQTAGGCGVIKFSASDGSLISTAQRQPFADMQKTLSTSVGSFIQNRITCRDAPASCQPDPDPIATFNNVPNTYAAGISASIQSAMASANTDASTALAQGAAAQGWIGAATWGTRLAKLNGSMQAATALPRVTPPTLSNADDGTKAVGEWVANGLSTSAVVQAQTALVGGGQGAIDGLLEPFGQQMWNSIAQVKSSNALGSISNIGYITWGTGTAIMAITGIVDGVMGDDNASSPVGMVENAAFKLLPIGRILMAVKKGFKAIVPQIYAACWALIVTGMALAYVVPALPMIRFYFAVVGWLLSFIECLLILPIALVLLVTPQKGGFWGPAWTGVLNVIALTVRPILTICGFVVSLMMIAGAIGLLNSFYFPLIQQLLSPGISFIGYVVYMIIYLVLCYVAVNVCTKAPEMFALAAYRVLGAPAPGEQDHGGMLQSALGGVVARFGTAMNRGSRQPQKPTK